MAIGWSVSFCNCKKVNFDDLILAQDDDSELRRQLLSQGLVRKKKVEIASLNNHPRVC